MGEAACVQGMSEAPFGDLGGELGPDPGRRVGVGEEDRAERDRARTGGDQLERVEPGPDSAHAHDRDLDGRGARAAPAATRDRR